MTLTIRMSLARKLGYTQECLGLKHALKGHLSLRWQSYPAYLRGYEEGHEILRIEGV